MKLLSIKSHGFKSFADKIEISVNDGITGIVGPNGSGKSNIVDAVRWVLGEQSVKNLRGTTSMSDVIFQGSKTRKPLTRAWVSLAFDNSDHYLNSEFTTIDIKRVVYSTGENEYYLNNSKVRLKDILDLFIDSGSSTNSFSIISQGKISEILTGKPSERRAIIEEAAGVLKYKKRKEEALKKLDKTNENLSKVNLVIKELFQNLEPLKRQAEDALKYKEYNEELQAIDIALMVSDITELNNDYSRLKSEVDELSDKISKIDSSSLKENARMESLKLENLKLENSINELMVEINNFNEGISNLKAKKQIISERKKYEVDDLKLENNLQLLKENELKIRKNISVLEEAIKVLEKQFQKEENSQINVETEYKQTVVKRANLNEVLANQLKKELSLKNKIDILNENINNNSKLPYAVKSILNNPRLSGIHNILGSLVECDEKYARAIEVALGFSTNVIVVDDEIVAKNAINYLKENKQGRATFFPISVIKRKSIDENTYDLIKNHNGFIEVAGSLVKYNNKYENVILNQLGNVIVVSDIDAMNEIGKIINYRYRIVTLSGELLNAGGSVTGGSLKRENGLISEKFELESLKLELNAEINKTKDYENEVNELDYNLGILENKLYQSKLKSSEFKESLNRKNIDLEDLKTNLDNVLQEINGINNKKANTLDKELETVLKQFYELEKLKELTIAKLDQIKAEKNDIQSELGEIELLNKKQTSEFNSLNKEKNEKEIEKNRLEVRLDNLLLKLNEDYKLTYDIAKKDYILDEDSEAARSKVNSLKHKIKALGEVNLGSIGEYERVNERYTFLSTQQEDLNKSIEDLLNVIDELDETMKDKFKSTFDKVNEEFKVTFKKLFRGGTGKLILTQEDDLLNTGVDIIASPPGKNLKSLNMLSGGEKTLTAIALLFSILNIRTVPFCILDEVEAALDEANVDMFGNYLSDYRDKTQFIIITHKKRTMEYAKTLYGITMQESGVSKLVSVRLDDID